MTFVDTGAWFAVHVPSDPDHAAAVAWYRDNQSELVTTDYILDELFTLLRARREPTRAVFLGEQLLMGEIATIEWVPQADVLAAWQIFYRFRDKEWSFTDCVSRVVMERLGITTAFAFDEHFRQFGTVTVVPH